MALRVERTVYACETIDDVRTAILIHYATARVDGLTVPGAFPLAHEAPNGWNTDILCDHTDQHVADVSWLPGRPFGYVVEVLHPVTPEGAQPFPGWPGA